MTEQLGDLLRGNIPPALHDHYRLPQAASEPVFPYSESPPKVKVLIAIRQEFLGQLADLAKNCPPFEKMISGSLPCLGKMPNGPLWSRPRSTIPASARARASPIPRKTTRILDFLCNPE